MLKLFVDEVGMVMRKPQVRRWLCFRVEGSGVGSGVAGLGFRRSEMLELLA